MQWFQPVPRRRSHIVQTKSGVQLQQLSSGCALNRRGHSPRHPRVKYFSRLRAREAFNHLCQILTRRDINVKRYYAALGCKVNRVTPNLS
jgi:hypothetical protein